MWRLQKDKAGSGALGDIGAHIIDLAQHVLGSTITGVSGLTETFVRERPLPDSSTGLSAAGGTGTGQVTVDDAALFLARFAGGAIGTFEATRFAAGRKNAMRLEINGSDGSLAFDFESMNELQFHDHLDDAEVAGFRRILVTEPIHPYLAAWWPPGHGLGYEHTFTHEVVDLVTSIGADRPPSPSFADGLQVQQVLAAVEQSAASESRWQPVGDGGRVMTRPITLFTGQWADLPFTEMCHLAADWGYDGLEIACWGDHLDVWQAAEDDAYVQASSTCSSSTVSRCSRSPTTSTVKPSATTRSTSGTGGSCRTGSGATGIRKAYASARPRR